METIHNLVPAVAYAALAVHYWVYFLIRIHQ
jgi:hypothetical protein